MRRIADLIDAFRPPGTALDVLHVGGGACALPRYVEATRPRSRQLVWEIDAGVVALARAHLGLRASPRLRVKVGDAAELIRARPDALGRPRDRRRVRRAATCRRSSRRPAFVDQVRRVLRPAGVYALNVIDLPPLDAVRAHDALVRAAFAHVAWVAPPGVLRGRAPGNVVLLASARAAAAGRAAARRDGRRAARAGPQPHMTKRRETVLRCSLLLPSRR